MIEEIFNHFRLTWRLMNDQRVQGWLKLFLIIIPLIYIAIPAPDDFIPIIGLLDDFLFFVIVTIIFNAICSRSIVTEHKMVLNGRHFSDKMRELEVYRHPNETYDLALGFILNALIFILGGYLAGIIMLFIFGISYLAVIFERQKLLANAIQIREGQFSSLFKSFQQAQAVFPPVKINLFVTQDPIMNAYTFGFSEPYSIVLTSSLVEKFDESEIQAVIGHEMGHILFEHVRINSIMGSQFGLKRYIFFFFYKWKRSCEYSADALALLASRGDVRPIISSLIKLTSGLIDKIDIEAFLAQLDDVNDVITSGAEIMSTHPFVIKRIRYLLNLANKKSDIQKTDQGL